MKKYYNETTNEWYIEGQSVTRSINGGLFSGIPTEEQLVEWGYEEWVEPTPPEPTEEELLEGAKSEKLMELEAYDNSDAVNSFTIGGQQMWLTREERKELESQINAHKKKERSNMTRWFGGKDYTFPIAVWERMLDDLLIYAGDALNVTEGHKAAINALATVEEVEGYDFKVGYPEKIAFNVNAV